MALILDAASKLEETRRCLGQMFEHMEPIRKALQLPTNQEQNDLGEAREALGRLDSALAEMKQTIEARGI